MVLAACLFAVAWLWAGFTAWLLVRGEPLLFDHAVQTMMFALRNPLADRLMAALSAIGSAPALGAGSIAVLGWLAWRKRWMAAAHWLAAIAVGLLITVGLGALVDMPRPPTASAGFGFPSIAVTMTTVVFGFFAVLVAREFPGRQRVWPYLVAGVATALVAFARLYLGAHWLSDVVAGMLLGVVWVLVLGIAYRRHSTRSFLIRPLVAAFYGGFALALAWHAPRSADATLAEFSPPAPQRAIAADAWWTQGMGDARHFDVEIAGDLAFVQHRLQAQGWQAQTPADWVAALGLLDDERAAQEQPVLPIALDGHPERLLLRRMRGDGIDVLRLWPAPVRLRDGTPLWVGRYERMQSIKRLRLLTLWQPVARPEPMPPDLAGTLDAFDHLRDGETLRLRGRSR